MDPLQEAVNNLSGFTVFLLNRPKNTQHPLDSEAQSKYQGVGSKQNSGPPASYSTPDQTQSQDQKTDCHHDCCAGHDRFGNHSRSDKTGNAANGEAIEHVRAKNIADNQGNRPAPSAGNSGGQLRDAGADGNNSETDKGFRGTEALSNRGRSRYQELSTDNDSNQTQQGPQEDGSEPVRA
jgi:hypothetical protein